MATPISAQRSADATLAFARASLAGARLSAAESTFKEVVKSDTIAAHKVEALVTLANLAWRVRRDTVSALAYLSAAHDAAPSNVSSWIQESRLERSFGNVDAAVAAATRALANARGPTRRAASLELAAATIERAESDSMLDRVARLAPTVAQLNAIMRTIPGNPVAARLLLRAGLLAGDTAAVLDGWRYYFLVGIGDSTAEPLHSALVQLRTAIGGWSARHSDFGAGGDLILALAHGRFFDEALMVAQTIPVAAGQIRPRVREVIAYARFLRRCRAITDEFYRATALGNANVVAWRDSLSAAAAEAWPAFVWAAAAPAYSWDAFVSEIGKRFGTVVRLGQTDGYASAHIGHIVWDARHDVEQYGHRAEVRFLQLDDMASNGFLTWWWDGSAATGGWNAGDVIVQIRPEYAAQPAAAWRAVAERDERARVDSAIAADSAADVRRARSQPVAQFPSVLARLARDGARALYDSLYATGVRDDDLQAAFVRTYSVETQAASIFAHEGRHAIDRRAGVWMHWIGERATRSWSGSFAAELEFNAKLSQVEFAPRPQLAFSGILTNIGDNTPHGQANDRVLRGLLEWMRAHASDIAGFDASLPILPQLPKLTSAQLRAAMRSMDPLG